MVKELIDKLDPTMILIQFNPLVAELLPALSVFLSGVSLTRQHPFGGEKSLNANWASGVDAAGGNTNLGAEPESVAIGHPA